MKDATRKTIEGLSSNDGSDQAIDIRSSTASTLTTSPKLPTLAFHETLTDEEKQIPATRQQQQDYKETSSSPLDPWCSPIDWYHRLVEHLSYASKHPMIVLGTFLLFAVLLTTSLYLSFYFKKLELETLEAEAVAIAEDTALFFANKLKDAVLPLFSLAHFVAEIPIFATLADRIGYHGDPNALPLISDTHRNVTGVCDDPELKNRFDDIAETLKSTANMEGVLVNLQLVPDAVVCLLYPLNNTEDFPPGMYLDSTGAVGHDLLADPERQFIAESTLEQSKLVVAGPLTLSQCPDCDPAVKTAFIARLPINRVYTATTATANSGSLGNRYGKWGFAVALINWENLVVRSGIYESFEQGDFEFRLTRTDRMFNEELERWDETVVELAVSTHYFTTDPTHQVQTALPTTNNEWEITIAYCTTNECLRWFPWAIVGSFVFSVFISILVYTIFIQKERHSDAIEEKSRQIVEAAKRSARNEREFNDFIAHEVRNPISAALAACSFVSASINESETEQLVNSESRKGVQEDVAIIESSLKYANDLLHSMLDLNRGNTEITVRTLPTDIIKDILQPVASMIHRKDSKMSFDVLTECTPDTLIVSVDRLRLKQIVLNLVRNSSRFVRSGGFIRIKACLLEEGLTSDGGRCGNICISVEDSGPGVPLDKQDLLFNKCQDSVGGAGIGLSLCKKMVDMMDASISLDKDYRSGIPDMIGAKFDVQLNCHLIKAENDNLSDGGTSTTASGGTSESINDVSPSPEKGLPDHLSVLFVDDDNVLRKLFVRSVRRIRPSWTTKEAKSGESALQICKEEGSDQFDIIFLDQYMSTVDQALLGTDTAREMRKQGVSSIICGLSANDMQIEFQAAGADFFMHKPFPCEPTALKEALSSILSGPRNTTRYASAVEV